MRLSLRKHSETRLLGRCAAALTEAVKQRGRIIAFYSLADRELQQENLTDWTRASRCSETATQRRPYTEEPRLRRRGWHDSRSVGR